MAIVGAIEHAAIHCMPTLHKRGDDEDRATVPRVPPVANYSRFSNMGVLSSTCTTRAGAIPESV
jgi:hypothetical protein